jgi:hypothetical protein
MGMVAVGSRVEIIGRDAPASALGIGLVREGGWEERERELH